ncbi:hypothetical protein PINS_up006685 [Pythium insidiosum]|nr:hypothetical protein PINS_up006685 [Pythium insidiosum]
MDAHVLPQLCSTARRLVTDAVLVHHERIRDLLLLTEKTRGEYYMSFLVLITVLEKALYDLYHRHHKASSGVKKKNMILRDLLHSDVLNAVLPAGLMALLKILLLPSGVNLRNLVWHGFLAPAEFPRCFASLTAALLFQLALFLPPTEDSMDKSPLFKLSSFDDRFIGSPSLDVHSMVETYRVALPGLSTVVPRGRERLVASALDALVTRRDELWFLFAMLPVLEHTLRLQFVRANASRWGIASDYAQAQIDQYYSTLDGFGQRDKHQVLLHPIVSGDDVDAGEFRLNALYTTLPVAALSVCLDLFMMSSGPNIRAKLCHGEAELSALLQSRPESSVSRICELVLAAWIKIAQSPQRIEEPGGEIRSSFHPFYQLCRSWESCRDRLVAFRSFRARWTALCMTPMQLDESAGTDRTMTLVQFVEVPPLSEGHYFAVLEKTSRLTEFLPLLTPSFDPIDSAMRSLADKTQSFGEQLVALQLKLFVISKCLRDHFSNHRANGLFGHPAARCDEIRHILDPSSSLIDCSSSPHTSACSEDASLLRRFTLALSDADGLSVSACMLDTLSSIGRSLDVLESRLTTLEAMIRDGRARTNHRRSFLNAVIFLRTFEAIQLVCWGAVSHHLVDLESCAVQRALHHERPAAAGTALGMELTYPQSRAFEQLQRKLLQFVTAFEGCTGSAEASPKSAEKAVQLARQFFSSKAWRIAVGE